MTQEVFYKYAKHFVAALTNNHALAILLLHDGGHGTSAVIENKVYPFVIASHMSILGPAK